MTKRFSLTPYLFLTPALIIIGVFVLYPILAVIYYSFTDYSIVTPPVWIGFKNFTHLFGEQQFWDSLIHSLEYLIVVPILIFFGILLAIAVNRKLPGINVFRALYYIPVISGTIAVGYAWRMMFDTNGLINGVLQTAGVIQEPVQWLAEPAVTLPLAMMLTIWLGLGYYMMIFLAGLQNIPEDLYDAALIDGCNAWQKHWHVSVPGLRPQIVFVAVASSVAALEVFNEIFTLQGELGGVLNSGYTIVFYLWRQAFRLQHAGYASAVALVLLAITLAFSILNMRGLERGSEAD